MAQKKITDLQLISSLTDDVSIPGDDGIQSYRLTTPQIMEYITAKLQAAGVVTPVGADHINILDASNSNAIRRVTVASLRDAAWRAVSTTDSVGADDYSMSLSGASFTSTLPTAVGRAGKRYKFRHAGTNFSQVYTITTTSSEIIGKTGKTTFKLHMNQDTLEVESNGTGWDIVNFYFNPGEIDLGNCAVTAVTTAPTKSVAILTDTVKGFRLPGGRLRMEFIHAFTTAGAGGSGEYYWWPSTSPGVAATTQPIYTAAAGNIGGTSNHALQKALVGHGHHGVNGVSSNYIHAYLIENNKITIAAAMTAIGSASNGFANANWGTSFYAEIRMQDWE